MLFTNLAALLIGFAFYANSLTTAQLVQEPTSTGYGLGASIVVSGLCLLPGGIAMVLLSPVSARISKARGPRFTLAIAAALMAAGYVVRMFTSENLIAIVAGATVVAAGTAVAYSALPALIMHAVPVSETAAANGLNTLMRTIGQAVCSADRGDRPGQRGRHARGPDRPDAQRLPDRLRDRRRLGAGRGRAHPADPGPPVRAARAAPNWPRRGTGEMTDTGRTAILRAARRAFARQPYAAVTLRGIAADAGRQRVPDRQALRRQGGALRPVADFGDAAADLLLAAPMRSSAGTRC